MRAGQGVRFRPAPRASPALLATAAAVSAAAAGGVAVGAGLGVIAIGFAGLLVAGLVLPRLSRAAGLPVGYFSIEIPLGLVLLSTLVFRIRDAEALAQDPLDPSAIFRLFCVGAAALLAWLTFLRAPLRGHPVAVPPAVFVFGLYTAVVFLGAPLSINLPLTAYRGVELAVGLFVILAAVRFGGRHAVRRLERVVFVFLLALAASVWLGLLLKPSEALLPNVRPIPYQLQGVLPVVASNGVGELGAVLFLWALGLRVSGRLTGRWVLILMAGAAVTLIAAQYRTGYFATAAALFLLLATRGRKVLAAIALLAALSAAVWNWSSFVNAAEPYVLRGQTREQAVELSGRMSFWAHAIPVWKESPIFGKGLLTGTRFEVLAPLGQTRTSTIHGTWVEALVGTGIVGVSLLLLFLAFLWRSALRDLVARDGLVYPALLVAFFTVKSLTGASFEVFGLTAVLLLVLAYVLDVQRRPYVPQQQP